MLSTRFAARRRTAFWFLAALAVSTLGTLGGCGGSGSSGGNGSSATGGTTETGGTATSSNHQVSELVVDAGSSVTLEVVPDPAHRVASVTVDGRSLGPVSTCLLENIDHTVDVEASFATTAEALMPGPASPLDGATITQTSPVLTVYNPLVADRLTYEFQVALDTDFNAPVAGTSGVPAGDTLTSWPVAAPLADHTRFYWRARATDGAEWSRWTTPSTFVVETGASDTTATLLLSTYLVANQRQVFEVPGAQPPAAGLKVTIPQGLAVDVLLTIASVENPPLPGSGSPALGTVYALAPQGVGFPSPVTLDLPYGPADLVRASVTDPARLCVFGYDSHTLAWKPVPVTSVNARDGRLVCNVDHFTMVAIGTPAAAL